MDTWILLSTVVILLQKLELSTASQPVVIGMPPFVKMNETNETVTILNFTVKSDVGGVKVFLVGEAVSMFSVRCNESNDEFFCEFFNTVKLDCDTATGGKSPYTIGFRITDSSGNDVPESRTLYINDVNDNSPKFIHEPLKWNIFEKPYNKSSSFDILATDFDSNEYGRVSLSMEPVSQSKAMRTTFSTTFQLAEISSGRSVVSLMKELDYETNNYYQFNVTAMVNIVDPLKLTQEFSTILANKIIATNVVATMILHKELYFFYEDTEESKVVKNIGNVTADSEISFEYGVRTKPQTDSTKTQNTATAGSEREKSPEKMEVEEGKATEEKTEPKNEDVPDATPMEDQPSDTSTNTAPEIRIDPPEASTSKPAEGATVGAGAGVNKGTENEKSEFPFQLQIQYTDTEGAKALRVITQTKPVTRDRKKAEKNAKMDILSAHTAMTAAKLAQEGMYTLSRERALMNQRVAWRNTRDDEGNVYQNRAQYKKAFGKIRSMENYLAARQKSERSSHGRTYSDDEDEIDEAVPSGSASKEPKRKSKSFFSRLRKKRSETTEDAGAAMILRGKNAKAFFDDEEEN